MINIRQLYYMYFHNFKDPETGRIRIRPLPNQGISTKLVIECRKVFRDIKNYP